ncbi:methylmalonyl-CoA mutase family protein [Paracoccaceae bacterium]|nr:methylmalonyl-CoA mutase family protein [Paracoccaceae bacterium]
MHSKPWIFRTYAGHSSAEASNKLFKDNLGKGQTGLSVAFDLPTQTGYDSDHQLARGEVGKVGVPINHLGDMRTLFSDIPLDQMNTSMTINATAPWLLALYVALAEEQELRVDALQGTVQNDIIKEYLSRGTYIFPPEDSLNLIADVTEYCYKNIPKWNPINICSYHLQEAGATIEEEVAFAISTATAVLDKIRLRVSEKEFPFIVGRVSFFVNAGIKFISEICKMRAFVELWNEICLAKYGVKEEKFRRFRYGVQVNSLGLTEQQPENNVYRILLELLAVTLSKNARARAIQLPAWNEAMGLPRPWDQQWSLRMQQVLAYETDLLEYEDIFDQNPVIDQKVKKIIEQVKFRTEKIEKMGGTVAALDYMKRALVSSNSNRLSKIENGQTTVVGVNKFTTTEESGLSSSNSNNVQVVDKEIEKVQISSLLKWKEERKDVLVQKAIEQLKDAARKKVNIMPASIEAAKAGVTTGEWADTMRGVFGEFRAPTGVTVSKSLDSESLPLLQKKVKEVSKKLKRRIKVLIGKPGLDGHSNGAEQIAMRAKEAGFDVVYQGIRLTPNQIVNSALEEAVHIIGLSILSGSHLEILEDLTNLLKTKKMTKIPVIVGGIIPEQDFDRITKMGVKRIYTPKDYDLNKIISEMSEFVEENAA